MAEKKETTKKKDTAKKKATPKKKAVEKKVAKPVEEKIEIMNGDPAVFTPKEEEVKVVENKENGVKKITKKINNNFGYLWNGQAIDF